MHGYAVLLSGLEVLRQFLQVSFVGLVRDVVAYTVKSATSM